MVFLSHSWGMGDSSECCAVPCYNNVVVHHHQQQRSSTTSNNSISGSGGNHHHHQHHHGQQQHHVQSDQCVDVPQALQLQLQQQQVSGKSINKKSPTTAAGSEKTVRHKLLSASLEDHHDTDCDEISIHPLNNQVS